MNHKKKTLEKITPYGYIAPITLILVVFVIGSVIISIVLSFTKYNIMTPPTFIGMKNYTRLWDDIVFRKATANTLKLLVLIVPLQMILSLCISVFLVSQRKTFLGKLANGIVFIPVLCSNAVIGVVWRELLNGKIPIIEKFFGFFGLVPSRFIGDAKSALVVVAMVAIWKSIGYYVVIYSSGLLGISETYYEAAKIDGAGTIDNFFRITLPLLKPTIILSLFLSVTNSLQYYDLIANLTGGGPNNASTTLVVYAYTSCFKSGNAGYAMAIGNVLFLIVLFVAIMQSRLLKRDVSEI